MKEIITNITRAMLSLSISGKVSQAGATPDFDCGLATQNMFVAATSMGLGQGFTAVPLLPPGRDARHFRYLKVHPCRDAQGGEYRESTDAVSGASPRKAKEEIVNWVR
jgi:nitroreductase